MLGPLREGGSDDSAAPDLARHPTVCGWSRSAGGAYRHGGGPTVSERELRRPFGQNCGGTRALREPGTPAHVRATGQLHRNLGPHRMLALDDAAYNVRWRPRRGT